MAEQQGFGGMLDPNTGQQLPFNPLSQFGFMSPQEQQLMQQQMEDQRAMQIAQLGPTQVPVYNSIRAGSKIKNVLNRAIAGKGTPTSDPTGRFSQIAGETGGDQGETLIRLGAELVKKGDARGVNLIAAGRKLKQDQEKAGLDIMSKQVGIQKDQGDIAMQGKGTKVGDLIEKDVGLEQRQKEMVVGWNSDGTPITRPYGDQANRSPKQRIENTSGDPRTNAQEGEDFQKFREHVISSDSTITSIRDIKKGLKEGAAQGWAATAVNLLNNATGTLEQLAPGKNLGGEAMAKLGKSQSKFKEWADKTGVNSAIWADLVSSLAKTYNTGGAVTEKDIDRAMSTVGANYSSPRTVAKILDDVERRVRNGVDRAYDYSPSKSQFDYQGMYDKFNTRWDTQEEDTSSAPQVDPTALKDALSQYGHK